MNFKQKLNEEAEFILTAIREESREVKMHIAIRPKDTL